MSFCKSFDVRLVPLLFFLIVAGCSETKEKPESGEKEPIPEVAETPLHICTVGSVRIENLWMTPAPVGGTSGLYGTISIEGEKAEKVVAIVAEDAERSELHEMVPGEGEEMKMVKMTNLPIIEKGKPLNLVPGGAHGMLLNMKREVKAGDSVAIGLVVESGDTLRCTAIVSTSSPAARTTVSKSGPGAKMYGEYCSACHGAEGKGQSGIFPPLAGSEFLKEKDRTIDAIVNGLQGEITIEGVTYNGIMPPLPDSYDNAAVADVINYVLGRFGEGAWQTTPEEVAGIRDRD